MAGRHGYRPFTGYPSAYTTGSPISLDGLRSYYRLEASGADSSINAFTLTENNVPTFVTGKIGNAVDLESGSSQSLSRAGSDLAFGDADYTIAGWINLESFVNNAGVVNNGVTTGLEEYSLSTIGGPVLTWRLRGQNEIATDTTLLSLATWYSFVVWHDSVANQIGISVNNNTPTLDTSVVAPAASTVFRIGLLPAVFFDGKIDEVVVFSRVWSAAERTAWYNGGVGFNLADYR